MRKLRNMIERGHPLLAVTQVTRHGTTTSNWLKARTQHATQGDKSMDDGTGQPVVTSWGKTRESHSIFFHEKTQHDGTAQSTVNEVIPRDRSGRPVVDPQREIRPQQFVIGNDEAE